MQKRVVAIHDISCVGKCSLTVALPILSAAGLETSILPTAVLSTHTGGFTGYTFRDLTDDIAPIAEHWKSLGLRVDAIYTGYLGSFRQLELVKEFIAAFRTEDTVVLTDPVMADNGKLYPGFSDDFAGGMAEVCKMADIVIPNLTEAALMLGRPYTGEKCSTEYVEELLRALTDMGPKKAVLTGISFEEGKLGAAAYDSETGKYDYYFADQVDGYYHGTGDVFGSAFLAAYLREKTLGESIKVAVDYTVESIKRTKEAGTEARYGVDFENSIPSLLEAIK